MADATDERERGEVRVTSAEPVTGESGNFEVVAKHYDELRGRVIQQWFV